MTTSNAAPERGSFSIRQNGITVAGGSDPYEDIKHEAQHYAAIYRQDGEVQVRVRRLPQKKNPPKGPPHANTI